MNQTMPEEVSQPESQQTAWKPYKQNMSEEKQGNLPAQSSKSAVSSLKNQFLNASASTISTGEKPGDRLYKYAEIYGDHLRRKQEESARVREYEER